jgi:hypothetical protein
MAPWALLMFDCSKMQNLSNPNLDDLQCSVLRLSQDRKSGSIRGKIRHAVPHGATPVCADEIKPQPAPDYASGSCRSARACDPGHRLRKPGSSNLLCCRSGNFFPDMGRRLVGEVAGINRAKSCFFEAFFQCERAAGSLIHADCQF